MERPATFVIQILPIKCSAGNIFRTFVGIALRAIVGCNKGIVINYKAGTIWFLRHCWSYDQQFFFTTGLVVGENTNNGGGNSYQLQNRNYLIPKNYRSRFIFHSPAGRHIGSEGCSPSRNCVATKQYTVKRSPAYYPFKISSDKLSSISFVILSRS